MQSNGNEKDQYTFEIIINNNRYSIYTQIIPILNIYIQMYTLNVYFFRIPRTLHIAKIYCLAFEGKNQ